MSTPTGTGKIEPPSAPPADRTVTRYSFTDSFPALLHQLGVSLLVTTCAAGKLAVLGTWKGEPAFSFHDFEHTMGVAVRPDLFAVGAKRQIWFLRAAPQLVPFLQPQGKFDACFLTRMSHFTGEIHSHELAWSGNDLWVVNTLFSCLCTLSPDYSFVPRWRPPFITGLTQDDRCHLNGFVLEHGRPRFVTMLGETNTPAGWRPNRVTGGCLMDVPSGAVLVRGLATPHSPRIHAGRLWMLESGRGLLSVVDPSTGRAEPVARVMGYTRGLDFHGPYAFVGLSKIRESSSFEGLPIAEDRAKLKCGVAVIDTRSGQEVASLAFHSGPDELFAVQVLPGIRCPIVSGYNPEADGVVPIWLAPDPNRKG
jgi:uncharacterized protein (TIGR03032 family)